jgi:hypothetical protein
MCMKYIWNILTKGNYFVVNWNQRILMKYHWKLISMVLARQLGADVQFPLLHFPVSGLKTLGHIFNRFESSVIISVQPKPGGSSNSRPEKNWWSKRETAVFISDRNSCCMQSSNRREPRMHAGHDWLKMGGQGSRRRIGQKNTCPPDHGRIDRAWNGLASWR